MIWFVLILAVVVGAVVALYTRNLKKALGVSLTLFLAGVVLSFLIVYSGIMGG